MKTCDVERHNCMEDSGISAWGKLVVVLCTKLVRQSVVPGRACLGASPDCRTLKMYGVGHRLDGRTAAGVDLQWMSSDQVAAACLTACTSEYLCLYIQFCVSNFRELFMLFSLATFMHCSLYVHAFFQANVDIVHSVSIAMFAQCFAVTRTSCSTFVAQDAIA